MKKKQARVTLKIESIAYGGKGVAHLDGKVVFIPHTLPGEEVEAVIIKDFPDYSVASLEKIIKPASDRIENNCKMYAGTDNQGVDHFIDTPGCVYGYFSYQKEIEVKNEQFKNFLKQFTENFSEPVISPQALHYRNKIILHTMHDHGQVVLGYKEEKGDDVIDVTQCPLAHPEINKKLAEIRAQNGFFSSIHDGMVVTLRMASDGTVYWWRNKPPAKASWIKEQTAVGQISVPLGGFFQINNPVTDILIKKVMNKIKQIAPESLIDLYCGCGLFSIAAHHAGISKISGLDCVENAIKAAEYNAAQHNLGNAIFVANSADKGFEKLVADHCSSFDVSQENTVLIIDPPRGGMGRKVRKFIRKTQFKAIIYISCAPDTLSRDLKILHSSGYHIEDAQMLDMFPRTAHFESLVTLTR
jgi:23S rRNA (uracil1939-C5)-methyltransferase